MKRVATFFIILLIIIATIFSGCAQESTETTKKTDEDDLSEDFNKDSSDTTILMLGRSVMSNWFDYWGSDTSVPVRQDKFLLYYGGLETPPEIANSAATQVDKYSNQVGVVFFKFCFDDFEGSSRNDAKANLERNKKYVEEVYKSVVDINNLKMIVGNALPKVSKYTESDLVWNHREYNNWLDEFAKEHEGEVYIFDQYDVLADDDGNLKTEFSINKKDSHLNSKGYAALDTPFLELLNELGLE